MKTSQENLYTEVKHAPCTVVYKAFSKVSSTFESVNKRVAVKSLSSTFME